DLQPGGEGGQGQRLAEALGEQAPGRGGELGVGAPAVAGRTAGRPARAPGGGPQPGRQRPRPPVHGGRVAARAPPESPAGGGGSGVGGGGGGCVGAPNGGSSSAVPGPWSRLAAATASAGSARK